MADTLIAEGELSALAVAALRGRGLALPDAEAAARVFVLADLFGLSTHGVSRIPQYAARMPCGIDPAARPAATRVAPGLVLLDGGNGVGPLVGMRALDAALDAAREVGIAACFVRGSNHFGPIMPYVWIAAEQGFASLVMTNATTTIAPWGGRDTRLGNNPLGIGVPGCEGADPVILDMAMSVAARAKIRSALARGEALPEGWAADADGRPTTDPAAALKGFLLPVGGHKGYGLAIMVDMLAGLLSGAAYLTRVSSWVDAPEAPQDLGHMFVVLNVSRLAAPEALSAKLKDFAAIIHDTPPADPANPVRLPGEREIALLRRQRAEGVRVAQADLDAMKALAA